MAERVASCSNVPRLPPPVTLRTFSFHFLRGLALSVALVLLFFGRLTTVLAPVGSNWTFAVMAGEYGHWGALGSVVIATVMWVTRKTAVVLSLVTIFVALAAAALLLKPAVQAWRIGWSLPERLAAQFGPATVQGAPLSVTALFVGRAPEPVAVRTLHVTPQLPLDFYPAAKTGRSGAAPCVIVVHGGGWHAGDRTQLAEFNHVLARHGYAVAAVSYRLVPHAIWPAQREDVLAAIAFLKAQAAGLGIDATRLVLLGRSAGGQIAQVVGYAANDPAIRGVIAFYAPSDLVFGYVNTHENDMIKSPRLMRRFLGGTPETARANYESASALNFVTKQSPPTLLLHGANDPLVWHQHSVRLEAKLREAGVPCVFVSLPWATHAFDYNAHGPGGQLATFAIEWFLAGVTK